MNRRNLDIGVQISSQNVQDWSVCDYSCAAYGILYTKAQDTSFLDTRKVKQHFIKIWQHRVYGCRSLEKWRNTTRATLIRVMPLSAALNKNSL